MFFDSSSLCKPTPRLSLRVLSLGVVLVLPVPEPELRLPYLFLRYLAQELRAAPSRSVVALGRSGDDSRDLSACDERLRDNSVPAVVLGWADTKLFSG